MTDCPFPYPGGKGHLAGWIIDQFPDHQAYVEVFGGAAGVLLAKSRSDVEIYNDRDGNLTTFFEVLRDDPDALLEWVRTTPYSRELHDDYRELMYGDDGAADGMDDLKVAGLVYYLQRSSFGGLRNDSWARPQREPAGKWRDFAQSYENGIDRLKRISRRFQGVTIECLDWRDLVDEYDTPETMFYFDPPYVDGETVYGGGFDHRALMARLDNIQGDFVVSYSGLPDAFDTVGPDRDSVSVIDRVETHSIGNSGGRSQTTERLIISRPGRDTDRFVNDGVQTSALSWTPGQADREGQPDD